MQFSTLKTARKNSIQPLNARKPQFRLPFVIREKNQNYKKKTTGATKHQYMFLTAYPNTAT